MITRKINFRKGGKQTVDLPIAGRSVVTFVGICPVTRVRLYECDTGNDPRGPLGVHAVEVFEASGWNMTGPDLCASWIACNNDRSVYERALALAKAQWVEVEE